MLYVKATKRWPSRESCLTQQPSISPYLLSHGFIFIAVTVRVLRSMVEECITLGAEQGFARGGARANFLQGWLLVEQGQARGWRSANV